MDENIIVSSFPFLNDIEKNDRQTFLDNIKIYTHQAGTVLFDSTICSGIFCVLEGSIRVYIVSDEGKEVTLYRLHKGGICVLSVSCILGAMPLKAMVTTDTFCRIALLDHEIFMDLQKRNFEIQRFIMTNMTKRLSDVMWIVEQVAFMKMDKRIGEYILSKNNKIVYSTHDEIARELGTAREVVSRMLKYFEKQDILKIHRGKFEILDMDRLREIIQN